MKVFDHTTGYTVVLDRGDEVMESLKEFAGTHGIDAATIGGIGALDEVVVGYFDLSTKAYQQHTLPGEYELLSLVGNITLKENARLVHAHVMLSGADLACVGGHLFSGRVAVTAEIQVTPLGTALHREFDEETGLFLIARD